MIAQGISPTAYIRMQRPRETNWRAIFFELVKLGIDPARVPFMLCDHVNLLMAELAERRAAERRNIQQAAGRKGTLLNVCVLNKH